MPTVIMSFPGGRYHATPWGHHVNEGQVEWPPCPWRLMRGLIATGYSKLGWTGVPPVGHRLINALANVLPTYQLPQASAAHSRHYMPIGELSKGMERTTLVFDTWANVGDDELAIRWDCDLDDEAAELFRTLVVSMGYLGRSESWVEARVVPSKYHFDEDRCAVPKFNGECREPEWEQIPLLAPVNPNTYDRWFTERTESALADFPLPEGNRKPSQSLLRKRAAAVAPFPKDLIDCLQKDTSWWKKLHNWSRPPGARRVLYWRRVDSLVVSRPRTARPPAARRVEAVLLAISTPTRTKSSLPHVHRTLPQGELFHRAIVGRVGKGRPIACPELIGRDELGKPLRSGHRHAHVLPLDLDGDERLDHVLVYAPMGLGDAAQKAIRSLKRTWTKGSVGDLQVAVVGQGDLDALRNLREPLDRRITQLLGPRSPNRARSEGATIGATWVSVTPFVAPRFVKRHGRNSVTGQIDAELESRGLPTAEQVELLQDESIALRHFVRVRGHGGSRPPCDTGYAIRFQLPKPVAGPIALGYGCHFGLGLFAAEQSNTR